MLLTVQNPVNRRTGVVPANEIKSIRSSHSAYNSSVNRLDYAAFIDEEPAASYASVSGFGAGSALNIWLAFEFKEPLYIKEVEVQTLKAATSGSWGINYLGGLHLQALVEGVWTTFFKFPTGLSSGNVMAPDGKVFNERWASAIPVGFECSGLRLFNTSGYVCASTFRPIMG